MAAVSSQTVSDASAISTTFPYTCNTCLVAFRNSDAQREHMRRDWHLYNVKRRVASLPPVSQEIFTEKVLTAKVTSSAATARASFEKTCAPCQKTFYSENSFQNHVKSSKHKLREAKVNRTEGPGDDTSSVMSSTFSLGEPISRRDTTAVRGAYSGVGASGIIDGLKRIIIEEDALEDEEKEEGGSEKESPVRRCLFCNKVFSDIMSNVGHMFKIHSMFIPEKDYLVNLEGLIGYLHEKITKNNECLYCHTIKASTSGIRTHMRDKGHCMIAFETEEEQIEIGQFYDFISTYSDEEEPGNALKEGDVKASGSEDDNDEEAWETDSSATSVADDEDVDDNQLKKIYQGSQAILQTEYELYLPSGRSVGHRSLARYYRQNLHNYPTTLEERLSRQQAAIENSSAQDDEQTTTARGHNHNRTLISRANGGMGLVGATASQKQEALSAERRERTRAQRAEVKYTAKVSRQANHQKHFRDPLLQ